MRNINWEEVKTGGNSLQAGAYVINIDDVDDNENQEFIYVIFDIAEGEDKGMFKDAKPGDDDFKHRFKVPYNDRQAWKFKRFLEEIEKDNPGFTVAGFSNRPIDLIGKKIGVLLQEFRYINQSGGASYTMILNKPLTIEEARKGVKAPDAIYAQDTTEKDWTAIREAARNGSNTSTTQGSVYDEQIPF